MVFILLIIIKDIQDNIQDKFLLSESKWKDNFDLNPLLINHYHFFPWEVPFPLEVPYSMEVPYHMPASSIMDAIDRPEIFLLRPSGEWGTKVSIRFEANVLKYIAANTKVEVEVYYV